MGVSIFGVNHDFLSKIEVKRVLINGVKFRLKIKIQEIFNVLK